MTTASTSATTTTSALGPGTEGTPVWIVAGGGGHPPPQPVTMWTRIRLELRKAVDTRSGLILTLLTLAWAPLVLTGWVAVVGADGHDVEAVLGVGATGVAVLLPVVTLLQVSGEWGQRSILTTLSLDPARGKVLMAKVLAGQGLAFGIIVVCLGCSLLAAALMGIDLGATDSLLRIVAGLAAGGMLYALMGSALGALSLSTALGVGLLLVGPQLVMNLGRLTGAAWDDIGPWVEISTRLGELTGGSVANWEHLLVACLLWIAAPLAVGHWRIRRADVA